MQGKVVDIGVKKRDLIFALQEIIICRKKQETKVKPKINYMDNVQSRKVQRRRKDRPVC